jgi:hypothetical protein
LQLFSRESMRDLQELADEAFADLLRKHGRPVTLKEALRPTSGSTAHHPQGVRRPADTRAAVK